ncbi:MAG TPA: 2OG-Fe(II) oxygenase [Thermoanaerobaculia bacterium]|nr:2OG-Fe(II) oxygenase [Thermoanaerobaculia bacterium]
MHTIAIGEAEAAAAIRGCSVIDGILPGDLCIDLAGCIEHYAAFQELPMVRRSFRSRPLQYMVIDGARIARDLPEIVAIGETLAARLSAASRCHVELLPSAQVACNVNLTPPGGAYRWHYDRNPFTAIVYLNEVKGGETEVYPRYRLPSGGSPHLQRAADAVLLAPPVRMLLGKKRIIAPAPGRAVVFRGDRCLHSVRAVVEGLRIALVFSFSLNGDCGNRGEALDEYLYTTGAVEGVDPNYRG